MGRTVMRLLLSVGCRARCPSGHSVARYRVGPSFRCCWASELRYRISRQWRCCELRHPTLTSIASALRTGGSCAMSPKSAASHGGVTPADKLTLVPVAGRGSRGGHGGRRHQRSMLLFPWCTFCCAVPAYRPPSIGKMKSDARARGATKGTTNGSDERQSKRFFDETFGSVAGPGLAAGRTGAGFAYWNASVEGCPVRLLPGLVGPHGEERLRRRAGT